MNLTFRQQAILEQARRTGQARIAHLARDMGVSLETVRRDVQPLVEVGELTRMHGGVRAVRHTTEAPFERRMRERHAEKQRLADHVAGFIEDGDSVMMDTGTTTSVLARTLLHKRGLTIVTNSSDVARTLATVNGNKVYMAGGELHGDNGAAFGRSAIEFITQFRVRFSIISISAIDEALGLMDHHLAEAEFARTVLGRGQRRIVVTDHSKFERTALVRVCGMDDIDMLVTDRAPPEAIGELMRGAGVDVVVP